PEPSPFEDAELWAPGFRAPLERFRRQVEQNYSEPTLARLLASPDPVCRRAAVLALRLVGTMAVNAAVAAWLRDGDATVRRFAADALWSIWFRGRRGDDCEGLQRVVARGDVRKALRGLEALIGRARDFAEAYNQRAILYYRLGEFRRAVADCEEVL